MSTRMTIITITASLCLGGPVLGEVPFKPVQELSFIKEAFAARPAVHRRAHRTAHRATRGHGHVDVDVDGVGRVRDVDVDVDRYGRYRSVDVDVDRRPAVGAVAAGVAIGTRVARLPTSCTTVVADNVTYHNCNGVYYRPYYQGTEVVYVVVDKP